jgi:3-hydroxy acid dehydrogenase / malonic semialdehyde reductase
VVLCARRIDALKKVEEACIQAHKESGVQQGGNFASIQLDVSDRSQIESFWDRVPNSLRNVDILGGIAS